MKVFCFKLKVHLICLALASLGNLYSISAPAAAAMLTLQQAEILALSSEPGLQELESQTQSMLSKSVSEAQLMDPKIQIGVLNLPTDSFEFDQEPMTQFKLSYIQQFPAGDTLEIKKQKAVKQSQQFQNRLQERRLDILKQVRVSYLEALYLEQAKQTIKKNRQFLSQLIAVVESLFAVGKNNQLDVLTVQLEQSKLDDRLTSIEQRISKERLQLSQWIGEEASYQALSDDLSTLPEVEFPAYQEDPIQSLTNHPRVLEVDTTLDITRKDIQLVEESAKPGWNLNVSYAYREDAPNGTQRADFLSAMVTFDLPLFTDNRQDKQRLSREYQLQAGKDKRNALLRKMTAELSQHKVNRSLLEQRLKLYRDSLIPQASQRSDAALQTYQSGKGQFSDVMKAFMDALNTQLDEKRIQTDLLQTRTQILYLSAN